MVVLHTFELKLFFHDIDSNSLPNTKPVNKAISNGTLITSKNKANEETWNYFINHVLNKSEGYTDKNGTPPYTIYDAWLKAAYGKNGLERFWSYTGDAAEQVVFGNYTDKNNALGTAGQIGLGLTGFDLPADIRDVSEDLQNWKWT